MESLKSFPKKNLIHCHKKKCFCGLSFEEIYFSKKVRCFHCYRVFLNQIVLLTNFKNQNLNDIYILEKETMIQHYLSHSPLYSLSKIMNNISEPKNTYSLLENISILPLPEIWKRSIRVRYTRNFSDLNVLLSKKEIIKISRYLFSERSFLNKFLDANFGIKFLENDWINVELKNQYINVIQKEFSLSENRKGLLRIYIGDEDHFRMDVSFPFKDSSKEEVNFVIKNLLKIYEAFLFLDKNIDWEFHHNMGFLTHYLTNLGSGIRIYTRIYSGKETTNFLKYFQRNSLFFRLKNYTIRGKNGENTMLDSYITIGWDLPYVDIKKFHNDIKKNLMFWFYLLSYTIKK